VTVSEKTKAAWDMFAKISCTRVPDCLHCFDTVGWASGRASSLWEFEWWCAGMVVCLERGANDVYMVQLMPLLCHCLLLHY